MIYSTQFKVILPRIGLAFFIFFMTKDWNLDNLGLPKKNRTRKVISKLQIFKYEERFPSWLCGPENKVSGTFEKRVPGLEPRLSSVFAFVCGNNFINFIDKS